MFEVSIFEVIIMSVLATIIGICVGMWGEKQLNKKTPTIRASQVHFYVARDKDGDLNLFLNKPSRSYSLNKWKQYNFYKLAENKHKWIATRIVEDDYFKDLGLNPTDFKNLKFEDEPVEVFLNLGN